jgi:hypothetical protein
LGGANNINIGKMLYVANYLQAPRKWTDSLARPKHWKRDVRIGTCNVQSLYRAGSLKTVARKLGKYKLVVLYGCETWSVTLREERRLSVFENWVLRRIFG